MSKFRLHLERINKKVSAKFYIYNSDKEDKILIDIVDILRYDFNSDYFYSKYKGDFIFVKAVLSFYDFGIPIQKHIALHKVNCETPK